MEKKLPKAVAHGIYNCKTRPTLIIGRGLTGASTTAVLVISQAGRTSAGSSDSSDSVVDKFLSLSSSNETVDGSDVSVVSSPNDSFGGSSLRGLLNVDVEKCEGIGELLGLLEELEEMRKWVSLAIDFKFDDSLGCF